MLILEVLLKNFSIETYTNGVELEYGNCWRKIKLPEGSSWNFLDKTCVSSTGIANDHRGEIYEFGGEINTKPFKSPSEQVDHISKIQKVLNKNGPAPIINYRSNLHIHVRVPGLEEDLQALKKLFRYIIKYQQQAFDITETIPTPHYSQFQTIDAYNGAVKRMKRRKISHQFKLSPERERCILNSTTPKEFHNGHAQIGSKGEFAWFRTIRAGINLRQLFESTKTIEFRHFPGSMDLYEIESCIRWCYHFVDAALNFEDKTPLDIVQNDFKFIFPKFEPFEFETEQVFIKTNLDKNHRKDVEFLLKELRKRIDIDNMNTSSIDVYKTLLEMNDEGIVCLSW